MSELDDEKKFYERLGALLDDPQLLRVAQCYGWQGFRRSSVLEGLETFVKANGFRGKHCVEIGTLNGLTAIVLARYFDHVTTIDVVDDLLKYKIAHLLGVENITFITVPDNAAKANYIRLLDFDGAYVDGDHARDTDSDVALTERCGQVLLHEHWQSQPDVIRKVNELRGRGTVVTRDKWALWRAA